jgi:hypothetical protein
MRRCESKNSSRAEAQEARAANTKCEGKNPLRFTHWVYSPTCALTSGRNFSLTSGTHHDHGGRTHACTL